MAEESSISGDEAPEEVTLSAGKIQDASRRKQERASQAEQKQLARKGNKRQNRASSNTLQSDAALLTDSREAEGDDLPEEVIASLSRDTELHGADTPESEAPAAQATQPRKRRRKLPTLQRQAGPVVVQVLNTSSVTKPSGSAMSFVQSQLHTSKRRSADMLRPPQNWAGRHRGIIKGGGPALYFVKSNSSQLQ